MDGGKVSIVAKDQTIIVAVVVLYTALVIAYRGNICER